MLRRYNDVEPDYFRSNFPDNEPLYFPMFQAAFPFGSKAYGFEDERRAKYEEYSERYITGIFGTEDNLKKSYMKIVEGYVIITDPQQYVKDYNNMVEGLQKWCRINHITYRAIGEPDTRVYRLSERYEYLQKYLASAEKKYEKWDDLRKFSEKQIIECDSIRTREIVKCSCSKDEDDIHYWYFIFDNIGHIGNYRLAIDVDFDRIEYIFRAPTELPDVHVQMYLTMKGDNFANPWACIDETYPLRADQISEACRCKIKDMILSAINEFDSTHKKEKITTHYSIYPEHLWGDNFFRRIKEDFDPYKDIRILFEDGKVWKSALDLDSKEQVEKYRKSIEEIKPYTDLK